VQGDLALARYYADHDRELTRALAIAEAEYKARPNVFAADTLAWVYYKNGRYDDARRTIEEALHAKTPDAAFLFHAGMISERLSDRPSAQRFLYQALSLNPAFHPVDARTATDALARLGS
jgi:tetratricopeptide (TPR) repeat protein